MEDASVTPEKLTFLFVPNEEVIKHEFITIRNPSATKRIAFKVKVSSPKYHFQVDQGESFIDPEGEKRVEIKLSHKGITSAKDLDPIEVSKSKFQVEIADATAFKVNKKGDNTKEFWRKEQGKGRKTILGCQLIEPSETKKGESVDFESKEEPIIEKIGEESVNVKEAEGGTANGRSTTHYDLSELISLVPKDILRFSSSKHEGSERNIILKNTSDTFIAYKMKVSVHQIFVVHNAEGFITPKSIAEVNVMMRELTAISDPILSLSNAKLAIDVETVATSELTMSPKEFWKSRSTDEKHTRFILKCVNVENVTDVENNDNVDFHVNNDASAKISTDDQAPFTDEAGSPIKVADEHRVLHSSEKPPPTSPKVGIVALMRSNSLDGPLSPVQEEDTLTSSAAASPSKEETGKKVSFEGLGRHRDSMEILPNVDTGIGIDDDISTIEVIDIISNDEGIHHGWKLRSGEKRTVHFSDDKKKSVHFDESVQGGNMNSSLQVQFERSNDDLPSPLRVFSEDSTFNPSSPNFRQSGASPSRIPTLVKTPLGIGTVAGAQAAREAAAVEEKDAVKRLEDEEVCEFSQTPPSPRVKLSPPEAHTPPEPESESTVQKEAEIDVEALTTVVTRQSPELTERLLDLLVKNVGTEELLSGTEILELKSARSKLSKLEWQDWLEIGRVEKQRRTITEEAYRIIDLSNNSDVVQRIASYEYSPYPEPEPEKSPPKQVSPIPLVQPIVPQGEPLTTFSETNSSSYFINYRKEQEENSSYISPGKLPPKNASPISLPVSEISPTPFQRFSMMSNYSKSLDLKSKQVCDQEADNTQVVSGELHDTILLNQQRIDSACAAAKTLLDVIESEDPQFIAANPGSRLNESKKSILNEMINALDRSRNELCDVASVTRKEVNDVDSSNDSMRRQMRREDGHLQESSLAPLYKIGTPRKQTHEQSFFSSYSQPFQERDIETSTLLSSPIRKSQHSHPNNSGERSPAPLSPSVRNSQIFSESINSGFSTSFDNVGHHNVGLYVSREDFSFSKHRDLMERNSTNINYRGGQNGSASNRLNKDTVIERLCVSERPVFKSDTFPIRVDVESAGIDVVWREPRDGPPSKKARSILRRERFQFDDVYAGLGAAEKLFSIMRKRVRRAINVNRGMVFLGLSCGETVEECKSSLEPPLALVFGDRGGGGVLSVAVDELFHTLRPPPKSNMKSVPASAVHAPYVNVTMTAVVLGGSRTVDLLGDFSSERKSASKECRIVKRPDGKTALVNATTVHLERPTDLERIIGVLLGKKGCRKEMMNLLRDVNEISQIDNTFGASQLLDPVEATMLITIHVSPITVGRLLPSDFHFVCPYGDSWSTASRDICVLAESLASFPHPPPPSMHGNSTLSRILLERPASQPCDFMCVANVSKSNKDSATAVSKAVPKFCSSINANSFRSLRQIPTVDVENYDTGSELIEKSLQVLRIVSHMPNAF